LFNYNQDDFTISNYSKLIDIAKKNYQFNNFEQKTHKPKLPSVLWRHDVDYSVHNAYELAKIEASKDVIATYFFQLGSEFYNIFEYEIKKLIQDIASLGHSIGLHFDPSVYQIKAKKDLEEKMQFERNILRNLLDVSIDVVSFHNPTPEILNYDDYELSGMINTYSKFYKKNYGYCSDSNGYWRFLRLEEVLESKEYDLLQVLTHPAWWQKDILHPRERIERCIIGRAKAVSYNYDMILKKFNRQNIRK
jgi:hypothetical protein